MTGNQKEGAITEWEPKKKKYEFSIQRVLQNIGFTFIKNKQKIRK